MYFFGLHIIDLIIVASFLCFVLGLGWWASRSVKEEKDFYLGGRKLGPVLQFFLNFGNMTDANGAPTVAAEVFRQGAGGSWIGLQTLFITPFYWFMGVWLRRVRVVTMADLFVDRFNSRSLATAYVLFNIYVSLLLLGFGNVVSYKVAAAMIVKPPAEYSMEERASVAGYNEYAALKIEYAAGKLTPEKKAQYAVLESREQKGELKAFISYITPAPFYIVYTLIVAVYITMGGLKAAAFTDALQGLLIVGFTIIMIPLGLAKIGGFHGLHQSAPEYVFRLFGTVAASDYSWYSIFAIFFTSLIQIFGLMSNMQGPGSAKDEQVARYGLITGAFAKRLVVIAWMFCGLIAIAMFPHSLSDPENVWGVMAGSLLGPGLMGLMISGMLLGHMPAVGANSIAVSALLARNVYEPMFKGRTPEHYLFVGQCFVILTLTAGVLFSLMFSGAVKLLTMLITFNAFFGAVVLLLFFWRKLKVSAIWCSLILWIVLIGLVPSIVPTVQSLRRNPALLVQTAESTVNAVSAATQEDVTAGLAKQVGESISKPHIIRPSAIYFESVAHINPDDLTSPLEGVGRFHVENYLLHLIHVPVESFNKAGILTGRWLVDGILPFVLLIGLSLIFPAPTMSEEDKRRADGFFAKMKTPVSSTPEIDEREVQLSYDQPNRFDHTKLFPGSSWEFTKWELKDFLGFFGCWGVVGLVLGLLWTILNIGS